MHEFIIEAIARGGYLGIFVLMALENIFPPVPSEVIMGVGGLLIARGEMTFWPLLIVAFVGTMNPSSGDVSVFLPLEHARLAASAQGEARTFLFARYTFVGVCCAALGSLATAFPQVLTTAGVSQLDALRLMFVAYGLAGVAIFFMYRALPDPSGQDHAGPPAALGPSRGVVIKLAALFSIDAFAGGLIVNTLLALWLFERFGLSLEKTLDVIHGEFHRNPMEVLEKIYAFIGMEIGESLERQEVILPRKSVLELARLLADSEDPLNITLANNQARIFAFGNYDKADIAKVEVAKADASKAEPVKAEAVKTEAVKAAAPKACSWRVNVMCKLCTR